MLQVVRYLMIAVLLSPSAQAMDCELAKALNHPALANDSEFWEKLSKLKSTDDRAIKNLISERAPEALLFKNTIFVGAGSTKEVFSINSKAEKARSKLSKINQKHFDEFIQVLTEKGPQGLREQPGRWNYKELKGQDGVHSVRLDVHSRIQFTIRDGVVHISDIGNHIGH